MSNPRSATDACANPPAATRFSAPDSLMVLAVVLVVRLGFLAYCVERPDMAYRSWAKVGLIPFGDARAWDESAVALINGRDVPEFWSARRPLYSWLLASVYLWTGPSFLVAIAINATASALACWLAYHVWARAAGRSVGLAVAAWLLFDPRTLSQADEVMCEAIGLLLLMLHLLCVFPLAVASRTRLYRAGIWLGLSNAMRPLSLFAVVGEAVCLLVVRRDEPWRTQLATCACLLLGVVTALAPFVVVQRAKHGIWALSDNSAEHFFAASSREYRAWSPDIYQIAARAGKLDVVSRYRFFQEEAWKNIRREPEVWLENVAAGLRFNATEVAGIATRPRMWIAIVGLVLAQLGSFWGRRRETPFRTPLAWQAVAIGVAIELTLAVLLVYVLGSMRAAWIVYPLALGIVFITRRTSLALMANLAFWSLTALALMVAQEDRHWSYIEWLVVGFTATGFQAVYRLLASGGLPKTCDIPPSVVPPTWMTNVQWIAGAFAVIFVTGSAARLCLARLHPVPDVASSVNIDFNAAMTHEVALKLAPRLPEIATSLRALPESFAPDAPRSSASSSEPRVAIIGAPPTPYAYVLAPGVSPLQPSPAFQPRDYRRTVLTAPAIDDRGQVWNAMLIWPGEAPRDWIDWPICFIGTVETVNRSSSFCVLNVAAAVPWNFHSSSLDTARASIANDPRHRHFLEIYPEKQ